MPRGKGKYDAYCVAARDALKANLVGMFVVEGVIGGGFSVVGEERLMWLLPKMLRAIADEIEETHAKGEN